MKRRVSEYVVFLLDNASRKRSMQYYPRVLLGIVYYRGQQQQQIGCEWIWDAVAWQLRLLEKLSSPVETKKLFTQFIFKTLNSCWFLFLKWIDDEWEKIGHTHAIFIVMDYVPKKRSIYSTPPTLLAREKRIHICNISNKIQKNELVFWEEEEKTKKVDDDKTCCLWIGSSLTIA